jgi:hypothetical protein
MKPWLIVGGGVAGLFAAKILKARQIELIGLEKAERLGGRTSVGHHRLYEKGSIEFFRMHFPELEFDFIDDNSLERKKGEWDAPKDEYTEDEQFFLAPNFYVPRVSFAKIIEMLAAEVGDKFKLREHPLEIRHAEKKAIISTGEEIEYEKLVWCAPLELLPKIWSDDKTAFAKSLKQLDVAIGGLNLDMELSEPLFPCRNTVVFPFRYKDKKLRALGTAEMTEAGPLVRWILMLEEEIADDREEVAKCVRTLKRELMKEFPELKDRIKNERIMFLPKVLWEKPIAVKGLELLPDLLYLGAQVKLPNTKEEPRNLDRILDNCHFFVETVG